VVLSFGSMALLALVSRLGPDGGAAGHDRPDAATVISLPTSSTHEATDGKSVISPD